MDEQAARGEVWKRVESIGTCMMVTHAGDTMRARPMRAISRPQDNAVWFFVDRNDHKDDELADDPAACLTFADPSDQSFVSLSGTARSVEDRAQVEALWTEGAAVYFPKGPEDPALLLLKFEPTHGEFWDSPSSPIVLAIRFLEAKLSGERPDMGVNARAAMPGDGP